MELRASSHSYASSHQTVGPAAALKMLTDDVALQYVLADIPFFAVGVFALGVFTFRMILRKYKWLTICLLLSAFLAFSGSILDLVQILGRDGKKNSDIVDVNPFLGIIIGREVAYAISFGLRYLWFWGFVACPPPGSSSQERKTMHSGSWARWGIIGITLQWLLAPTPLAIASLQILYRVFTPLAQYGPVYEVEGTMQIILSAIFILKLLLNIYLVALDSPRSFQRGRTFLRYLPVIMALLINLGVGVGNIFEFLFSETVLGRFLQAVELYMLILYSLVATFCRLRNVPSEASFDSRRKRSSSFQSPAALDTAYLIPPPRLSPADLSSMFQVQGQIPPQGQAFDLSRPQRTRRSSYTARMSNWFVQRRPSARLVPSFFPSREKTTFQMQDDPERGMISPFDTDEKLPMPSYDDFSHQQPSQSNASRSLQRRSTVPTKSILSSATSATILAPPRARIRFSNVVPKASTPVIVDVEVPTPVPSPTYGPNGIVNALTGEEEEEEDPRAYFDNSPRSSDISGLLRQQEELDRSIAALRLFSTSPDSTGSQRAPQSNDAERAASPRSEFSLSIFPQPPWKRSSDDSSRRKSTDTSSEELPSTSLTASIPAPPSPAFAAAGHRSRMQSIPSLDNSGLVPFSRNRIGSAGTQYEITSFIGNLTQPGHKRPNMSTSVSSALDPSFNVSRSLQSIQESPLSPEQTQLSRPVYPGVPGSPLRAFRMLSPSPSTSLDATANGDSAFGSQPVKLVKIGLPSNPRVWPSSGLVSRPTPF